MLWLYRQKSLLTGNTTKGFRGSGAAYRQITSKWFRKESLYLFVPGNPLSIFHCFKTVKIKEILNEQI